MIQESLADLDELIIKCRSQAAKKHIAEAVACYKAGAYRSCIVATWIAVVYDFISKLMELDLTGDNNAQKKLKEFERICESNNVSASLEFEKSILNLAKNEFELLTQIEFNDLLRLFEDRNRCAHPSMLSIEEPYKPTAELARYHMKNVVVYFLQRPPVQGKAALDRIWADIKSEYFPVNHELAIKHFNSGPLIRAKDSLIRNIVIGLTKDLLRENRPEMERARQFSALKAVNLMYPALSEKFTKECLSETVSSLKDSEWEKVIEFIYYIPISWDLLDDAGRIKARQFVESIDSKKVNILAKAVKITSLKEVVLSRISEIPPYLFSVFVKENPIIEVVDTAIDYFINARAWTNSYNLFKDAILPTISLFNNDQVKEIIKAFTKNDQIYGSFGITLLYRELFTKTISSAKENIKEWNEVLKFLERRQYGEELQEIIQKFIDENFSELS